MGNVKKKEEELKGDTSSVTKKRITKKKESTAKKAEEKSKTKKTTKKAASTSNKKAVKKFAENKEEKKIEELSATQMYPIIDDKTVELHLAGLEDPISNDEVKIEKVITDKPSYSNNIPTYTSKRTLLDRFYFGATQRIVVYIIIIALFLAAGFAFLRKAYDFSDGEVVNYKEQFNLDYRVNLKPNDFYPEPYLNKNLTYVASLIDSVDVSFDYQFDIDRESKLKLTYYTYAVLSITDKEGNDYIPKKEYQLSEPEEVVINNGKKAVISKKVNIDYGYYNSLANQFRTTYGVSTDSVLKVYLKIMKTNQDVNKSINFVESDPFSLDIPLSEKTININMNYKALNENNEVLSKPAYNVSDKKNLTISICFFILAFCFLAYMIKFMLKIQIKKSTYDKYVEKLLREYDRLIVTTVSKPDLNSDKVIKLKEFNELLDVRDTVQLPIMYYEVNKHQKCYFYINQADRIYLLTIKAIDLENK